MAFIDTTVDLKALTQTGEVVVYGAGNVGRDVVRVLTSAGVRVMCVLDRSASTGSTCLGVSVHRPDECPIDVNRRAATPVVIAIFNPYVDIPALAMVIRSLGFHHVVPFADAHQLYSDAFGDRYWLTARSYWEAHSESIARAESVFTDEQSRATFRSLIEYRRSGICHGPVNAPAVGKQYLPADVERWRTSEPVRFVDCGAYTGDSLEQLLSANVPMQASVHFEPDRRNFAALVSRAREHRGRVEADLTVWPCAVGSATRPVRFADGLGEASTVSDQGAETVMCVALDDVLINWRPTVIKMDIEGAELDALTGARHVISAHRPRLAICLYHMPNHLWTIPLSLSSWSELSGYRYYLRVHAYNGFETVMYGVPQ